MKVFIRPLRDLGRVFIPFPRDKSRGDSQSSLSGRDLFKIKLILFSLAGH